MSLIDSQQIVSRSLSKHYDVDMIVDKNASTFKAKIEENEIIVPFAPRNFNELKDKNFRAGLDHEVAHLKYTNAVDWEDHKVFKLLQAIEDGRVNKKMSKKYKGCKTNLQRHFNELSNEFSEKVKGKESDLFRFEKVQSFLYEKIWHKTDNIELKKKYNIPNSDYEKLKEFDFDNIELNSTQDSLNLAKKVRKIFGEDEGETSGEEDENENEQNSILLNQPENSEEEVKSEEDELGVCAVNELQQKSLEEELNDYKVEIKERDIYNPYTEEDTWVDITEEDEQNYDFKEDKVQQMIQRFLRDFREWVKKTKRFQKKGRLDSLRTTEVISGLSDNVYKKNRNRLELDTAISFLVDLSGSMRGKKINNVRNFCYFLSKACKEINVPVNIMGYTTGEFDSNDLRKIDKSFNRKVPLKLYDIMNFEESNLYLKDNLSRLTTKLCGGLTVIGEPIEVAEKQLMNRPEKKKIIILLSDGRPTQRHESKMVQTHFKQVVDRIKRDGIVKLVSFEFLNDYKGIGYMDKFVDDSIHFKGVDNFLKKGYNKFIEIVKDKKG